MLEIIIKTGIQLPVESGAEKLASVNLPLFQFNDQFGIGRPVI